MASPTTVEMPIKPQFHSEDAIDPPLLWDRLDNLLLGALTVAGIVTRLWRLGYPNEPVFDEIQFVGQALAYLRGERFLDVHPPLPKLLIALSIKLAGHDTWAWRFPSACLGVLLVPVTFLLGRELFRSRVAAALAASFVICDGAFLIHSRLAMLEIFHVTFTAIAYLLLFQILRTRDPILARRKILYAGLVSGAALASKLMLPAIAFLLLIGFLINGIIAQRPTGKRIDARRIVGTLVLLASTSSLVYLGSFMPKYWLGWWSGAWALVHYYSEVVWQLGQMSLVTSPFVSPWWSWPLMLRAPVYWQSITDGGLVSTIWQGGNPVLWWASIGALVITGVREFARPTVARSFLLIGYFSYMVALALSKHPFFLYIYVSPLYLQYLMLACLISDCWYGRARQWEQIILIICLVPAFELGLGGTLGTLVLALTAITYILASRFKLAGRFTFGLLLTAALAAFVYFLPLWIGTPLQRGSYSSRIWLNGTGVDKWM